MICLHACGSLIASARSLLRVMLNVDMGVCVQHCFGSELKGSKAITVQVVKREFSNAHGCRKGWGVVRHMLLIVFIVMERENLDEPKLK